MTTFTNIVPGRLWQVENLLEQEQVDQILSTDWLSLAWTTSAGQESWQRRQIQWNEPRVQELSRLINDQLPAINQAAGTEFVQAGGQFWVDQPGFTVGLHTDGHLPNSLQMYWIAPSDDYGTGFYNYKTPDSLLYQFASRPNTGYLMLNHPDADGSQPLQWHGMFRPVPEGHIRVTSYWQFS